MNAQITSGRGDRFIVIDTQNNSIVTNAVILFPYQDQTAYTALKYYCQHCAYQQEKNLGDFLGELDKIWINYRDEI